MTEVKRQFDRLALYENDVPPVIVAGCGKEFSAQLYDVSPLGAGLFIHDRDWGNRALPVRGQPLLLNIRLNKQDQFTVTGLVCHVASLTKRNKQGKMIGLTFVSSREESSESNGKLLPFVQTFRPLAYAEDPLLFQEFLHFQIEAFSPTEVLIRTSKSNRSLVPGQSLNLVCLLPNAQDRECKVRIMKIESQDETMSSYVVRARWLKPTGAFVESLAEFILIARPGISITEMKKMGWPVTHMQKAIRFRYVSSEKDMRAVLDLRLIASQDEGLWTGSKDSSVMLDGFDSYARQLMCIVGAKVVASARLVFNEGKRSRSEHASYGAKIPPNLWKDGFLDASQICTHPQYRGADVFHFLLQHLIRITSISEARYLLIHSAESMVPIYQRLGAKNLKTTVEVPALPGGRCVLMVFDCKAGAGGLGGSFLHYNVAFKKMADFTAQQGLLSLAPHHDIYRRTLGIIEPLAMELERRKRKSKK